MTILPGSGWRRAVRACRSPRPARGFTLVESLVVVGIAGVLSSIAYPSFEAQFLRTRRLDALTALLQVQLAEEHYRADHGRYATLSELGLGNASSAGHYALDVSAVGATTFAITATAAGRQGRDASCRTLRLVQDASGLVYASGADARADNADAANRRCWGR